VNKPFWQGNIDSHWFLAATHSQAINVHVNQHPQTTSEIRICYQFLKRRRLRQFQILTLAPNFNGLLNHTGQILQVIRSGKAARKVWHLCAMCVGSITSVNINGIQHGHSFQTQLDCR
jgi:hypothetical protein